MSSSLAIFDIDGTLCDSVAADDQCFTGVAAELLQVRLEPSFWERAPQLTDAGIAEWLWHRYRNRSPTAEEIEAFVTAYARSLAREQELAPNRFRATRNALPLLELLPTTGWDIAIATGGWRRTALLKLAAAGLPSERLLACSDDSQNRVEVFELARRRAETIRGAAYTRIVLVGDASWDVQVALHRHWAFVGIGCGERAERLRAAGAGIVVADFADASAFVTILQRAVAPGPVR
jgi:phosphoglycolate phosphatase-like HAD superfamily hydrolase